MGCPRNETINIPSVSRMACTTAFRELLSLIYRSLQSAISLPLVHVRSNFLLLFLVKKRKAKPAYQLKQNVGHQYLFFPLIFITVNLVAYSCTFVWNFPVLLHSRKLQWVGHNFFFFFFLQFLRGSTCIN